MTVLFRIWNHRGTYESNTDGPMNPITEGPLGHRGISHLIRHTIIKRNSGTYAYEYEIVYDI